MLPLGFLLSCGKSAKYRFIEFFVFDYDSLPNLLPVGGYCSFSCSIKLLDCVSSCKATVLSDTIIFLSQLRD